MRSHQTGVVVTPTARCTRALAGGDDQSVEVLVPVDAEAAAGHRCFVSTTSVLITPPHLIAGLTK